MAVVAVEVSESAPVAAGSRLLIGLLLLQAGRNHRSDAGGLLLSRFADLGQRGGGCLCSCSNLAHRFSQAVDRGLGLAGVVTTSEFAQVAVCILGRSADALYSICKIHDLAPTLFQVGLET